MTEPTKQEITALSVLLGSGALGLRDATVSFYIDRNGTITTIDKLTSASVVLYSTRQIDKSKIREYNTPQAPLPA